MTLLEFIDDHFMSADIKVYSSNGKEIGTVVQGDESCLNIIKDYARGEIVRDGEAPDGSLWVYVQAKPLSPERGPVLIGYPGEVEDEAAFSLDWRSREPKASPKQVSFLYKNIRLYMSIKKPGWPNDPKELLRYEASDAMTIMLSILKGKKGGD